MKIHKNIVSRKGNRYEINLTLSHNSVESFLVKDFNGKEVYAGHGSSRNFKEKDYLVKLVEDVILLVEENYGRYDSLKSFEEWDGVIK